MEALVDPRSKDPRNNDEAAVGFGLHLCHKIPSIINMVDLTFQSRHQSVLVSEVLLVPLKTGGIFPAGWWTATPAWPFSGSPGGASSPDGTTDRGAERSQRKLPPPVWLGCQLVIWVCTPPLVSLLGLNAGTSSSDMLNWYNGSSESLFVGWYDESQFHVLGERAPFSRVHLENSILILPLMKRDEYVHPEVCFIFLMRWGFSKVPSNPLVSQSKKLIASWHDSAATHQTGEQNMFCFECRTNNFNNQLAGCDIWGYQAVSSSMDQGRDGRES